MQGAVAGFLSVCNRKGKKVPVLILIFIALWAWAELAVFIAIGSEVGVLLTIIGIVFTAIVGIWLLKNQGRAILIALQHKIVRGETPLASMADGAAIAAGAVLMLIPGYITDAMGLLLFFPGIRTLCGAWLISRMVSRGAGRFSFQAGVGRFEKERPRGGGFDDSFDPFHGSRGSRPSTRHHDAPNNPVIEGDFEEKPADRPRIEKP
ncbi:MAG: hypothetical protein CMM73_01410 [Rhodospirillaceae bacterium]|nr:hypothetical protein [Rhodospirillaceae bacterium]